MSADAAEQAEEAESLTAIFGDDIEHEETETSYRVYLPSKADAPVVVLRVLLPSNYPSAAGPVMELDAPFVSEQQLAAAVQQMESMFCPGQVCLFDCIEWLREQIQQWRDELTAREAALASALEGQLGVGSSSNSDTDTEGAHNDADADAEWAYDDLDPSLQQLPEASGRQHGREQVTDADQDLIQQMRRKITSGEPNTERKSTFQAHVAHVTDVQQVKAVVAVLLESNKIRNATHNIMAYRIAVPDRPGVFLQDCDDDGEAAAGGRLLHLLQVADVQDAVVVVSRWFGGVLLGPARFGLINNTARQLLEQTGFIKHGNSSSSSKQGTKKHARKQKH